MMLMTYLYRLLQDKVDMLEAEKDSHVNKISDLRSLLRKVNSEGEKRVNFIRNKNVIKYPFLTNISVVHSQRQDPDLERRLRRIT